MKHDAAHYCPNPYMPFPFGFGDMRTQTANAERHDSEKGRWYAVRVNGIAFDDYTRHQVRQGGSLERIFPGITKSLGREPDDSAEWLYSVESVTSREPASAGGIIITTAPDELKTAWFDGFDAMLDYCAREFGLTAADFRKKAGQG